MNRSIVVPESPEMIRHIVGGDDPEPERTTIRVPAEAGVGEVSIIRDLDSRIFNDKARVRVIRERLQEIIEENPAYAELVTAKQTYKTKEILLQRALRGNMEYNRLTEELAAENETLRDDRDILSTHIVEYHARTHEQQVEVGDGGDARDLVITGKLGRKAKYQTSLFNQGGAADEHTE